MASKSTQIDFDPFSQSVNITETGTTISIQPVENLLKFVLLPDCGLQWNKEKQEEKREEKNKRTLQILLSSQNFSMKHFSHYP